MRHATRRRGAGRSPASSPTLHVGDVAGLRARVASISGGARVVTRRKAKSASNPSACDLIERRLDRPATSPSFSSAWTMMNARTPRSGVSGARRTRTSVPAPDRRGQPTTFPSGARSTPPTPRACSVRHADRRRALRRRGPRPRPRPPAPATSADAEQHVHDVGVDRELVATHAIEHRLQLVRELGDGGVAHRRAHALDRVDGAENRRRRDAARRARSRRARARAARD